MCWGTGGGDDPQPAHGLCFSSFNCRVNHHNQLFTAPNSLGLVGSKAKMCLEMNFLGPEEEGRRWVSIRLWWERGQREKVRSCGNCAGQRSQGSLRKLFQGAQHPLSRWFSLNFNLRAQPSLSPLSLRHVSHTKSAILSRPLLAQFQSQHGASRTPSPRSEPMPELCRGPSHPGRRETWDASSPHP